MNFELPNAETKFSKLKQVFKKESHGNSIYVKLELEKKFQVIINNLLSIF